ncbi:hypothetical protein BPORC_1440 [Bifidobacterium porcinum]|nr:hypothetical protein BPORC_1440 [Bifidobacterium porcinum]
MRGESGLLDSDFRRILYAVAYVSLHFGSQVGRDVSHPLRDVCRGMRNESDVAETCLRWAVFCGLRMSWHTYVGIMVSRQGGTLPSVV